MNEVTIPPSAGWYLSGVLALNRRADMLAYGAKHELVLIDIDPDPSRQQAPPIKVRFVPLAHKDRITGVAFSPASDNLVTSSDDGSVKVWDASQLHLLYGHSGHPEGQKLPSVDWSSADVNLVVSVSDLGSIVCWDLLSNTIRRLYIGSRMLPTVVACSPHNKEVIAVGAKAGLIIIYSIKGDGQVIFRIRGHESDVVSLAWCPVPDNIFRRDSSEKVYLLASGAKDRSIYFWRTGTDGRFETCLNLPPQPLSSSYRNKNGVGGAGNCWVCVRWPSPHLLITSSQFGELLSCNLQPFCTPPEKGQLEGSGAAGGGGSKKQQQKNKGFKLVHGNHSKGLFSIAVSPFKSLEGNDPVVWTCALDKHIVAAKLASCKVVVDITAIGGIVYCLATSPLDPNRLALGLGDNKVLVWNMSNGSYDDVTTFWHKINNKVMAVAWHPTMDSILAFGTGEGRVGVMDVSSNKPPIVLRLHHRRSVYNLIWAPPILQQIEKKSRKWEQALFSVGDGDILQYDIETPDKEPLDLGPLISKCDEAAMMGKSLARTDLAWNHNRSLASIGNENGVVYIVDGKTFEYKQTIFAHKKLVQCLVWHPPTVTSQCEMSAHATWLASASDNIQVINVTEQGFEMVATLTSHTEKVVSLAWSPHFNARLVSASYDYTCQVWDVLGGCTVAIYDMHHNAVLCCLPSPLHPDIIITGSADSTLRLWNINNHISSGKPKSKKQRMSGVMKKFAGVQEASDLTAPDGAEFKQPAAALEKVCEVKGKTEALSDAQMNKRKNKSMFPVTSGAVSHARHLDVLWSRICHRDDREEDEKSKEEDKVEEQSATASASITVDEPQPSLPELGYLDFFGDSKAIRRLLMVEGTHHMDSGHTGLAQHMSLWLGDIADTIKEALRKKCLNEWLVSLAPMISHKLWGECCLRYAGQLVEAGDVVKAASYYLAVHRIEEAVDVLLDAKLVREAVALAKCRLSPSDPTTTKALVTWANQANSTGMLNLAAHCLVSAGKVNEAIEMLSRSKEASSLALAGHMASKIGCGDMALSLVIRSINISLVHNDFTAARQTLAPHPNLQDFLLWVDACAVIEERCKSWAKVGVDWLTTGEVDGQAEAAAATITEGLYEQLCRMYSDKTVSYQLLVRHMPSKPPRDSLHKTWIYIGGEMSLAVAAGGSGDGNSLVKHLINALNAAYLAIFQTPSTTQIFVQLASWISPKGPTEELEVYKKCDEGLARSTKTFVMCSAIYLLDQLLSCSELSPDMTDEELERIYRLVRATASLILTEETMTFYRNGVEIKRLENCIAAAKLNVPARSATVKYCSDLEAELCKAATNENPPEQVEQVVDNTARCLSDMKTFNRKFETERLCCPNPFVIYCCITNVVESLVSFRSAPAALQLLKELNEIWESVSNEELPSHVS